MAPEQISIAFELVRHGHIRPAAGGQGLEFTHEPPRQAGVYLFQFLEALDDKRYWRSRWYVGQSGNLAARFADYARASGKPEAKSTTSRIAHRILAHVGQKKPVIVELCTEAVFSGSRWEEDVSLDYTFRRLMLEAAVIADREERIRHEDERGLNAARSRRPPFEDLLIEFAGSSDEPESVEVEEKPEG